MNTLMVVTVPSQQAGLVARVYCRSRGERQRSGGQRRERQFMQPFFRALSHLHRLRSREHAPRFSKKEEKERIN